MYSGNRPYRSRTQRRMSASPSGADRFEVRRREVRPCVAEDLRELVGVAAQEERVEVVPVHVRVGAAGGREVFGVLGRGVLGLEVQHDPDGGPRRDRPIGLDGGPVGAQQIVRDERRLEDAAVAGRERPREIPRVRDDPRLVQGRPRLDAVVESPVGDRRVRARLGLDLA